MTSGRVKETSNFIDFANLTVEIAKDEFDDKTSKAVRDAWNKVGVKEKEDGGEGDNGDDSGSGCRPM